MKRINMNGKIAKKIRLMVYGSKHNRREVKINDPRFREYVINNKTGQIKNNTLRLQYQAEKKRYKLWMKSGRTVIPVIVR